jgi:hypothetical protein
MTTNAMSCEVFNDRLMAYLEHETDDATRVAIERHSVTCDECGALLADLRKLRIDSTNLPPMQPSRDLWAGIAARIAAPVVPIGRTPAKVPSETVRRWTRVSAIAASLVFAAGVGYMAAGVKNPSQPIVSDITRNPADTAITQDVARVGDTVTPVDSTIQTPASPTPRAPAPTTVATGARSPEVQAAFATMTADYDREIARMRVLIEQRRNQLDPATVAVIERNLAVIDTAIAECKKAIVGDPSSRFLIESLNQSLRSKVELMRTAALLPSRT